jgi:hypothetical protein
MALTDFSGQIPLFLASFLGKPASALPKNGLWVVDLEGLNNVKKAILETARLEPNKWDVEQGLNTLIGDSVTTDYSKKGCLFCQAVSVPGESTVVNPEGLQKNHFLMTATGDGRGPYTPTGLRMVFLDTNVSFVDNVIRPWVITTARLGMIARTGDDTYRQDITVYKLGVYNSTTPPFILQKYTFYGTCPIDVSAEEYNYSPTNVPVNREATFVFHSYKLETNVNSANLAIKNN